MKAIEFKETNCRLAEEQPQYLTLPVYYDGRKKGNPVTMCFELDEEELKQVKETGKIWLTQLTGGINFQPIQGCLKPEQFQEVEESTLEECEGCGGKFQVDNMFNDEENGNWFCKKCAGVVKNTGSHE